MRGFTICCLSSRSACATGLPLCAVAPVTGRELVRVRILRVVPCIIRRSPSLLCLGLRFLSRPLHALLAEADTRSWIGELDEAGFTYTWRHGDVRMDRLHQRVSRLVEKADASGEERDNRRLFHRLRRLAAEAAGVETPTEQPFQVIPLKRRRIPRLTEAWFC